MMQSPHHQLNLTYGVKKVNLQMRKVKIASYLIQTLKIQAKRSLLKRAQKVRGNSRGLKLSFNLKGH